jgi:hypothetical protein
MTAPAASLWDLAYSPAIDAAALADAVAKQGASVLQDVRTRLLLRDSLRALQGHWGEDRFRAWMSRQATHAALADLMRADPEQSGFPSLSRRIVDAIRPETVLQFLRELSLHVDRPTRLAVGGSTALILRGLLVRHTEDIDVVDEVPTNLREQHDLLDALSARYGLRLTHFQSHYLPAGWEQRLRPFDVMGPLRVELVDEYDLFVGKLFSAREKDRDDLRSMLPLLDRTKIVERMQSSAGAMMNEPSLRDSAARNWFILCGTPLPT